VWPTDWRRIVRLPKEVLLKVTGGWGAKRPIVPDANALIDKNLSIFL
jgi:hypothetical protein